MKLCLNCIVKNETARLTRMLDSVVQYIDCYAITDTGSTDDTPRMIKEYFAHHHIPGIVSHVPFVNWSQARNNALLAARSIQKRHGWDWALLIDADMELVVKDLDALRTFLDGHHARGSLSLVAEQRGNELHYMNTRLVSSHATGVYRGVTHEYLDVPSAGEVPPALAYMNDYMDGANRPSKTERDIRLLLAGLDEEPDNSRYYYYLAQSYREQKDWENAKLWYKKRVEAGGWAEEQWSAQFNYAHCLRAQKDEDGFIREMLVAYNMRPGRAEALYDLANHFRVKPDQQHLAAMFAEAGLDIPRTTDQLFVNDFVYTAGLKEEFAITGFYNEQKRAKAFKVCSDLSLQPGPYEGARATARQNLYYYLPTLKDLCPSFVTKRIPFDPPEGWVALNPSVANHGTDNRLWCVVRTVNYRIDEHGRYLIRGTDGTANGENPINTRNYLIDLGFDPHDESVLVPHELLPPGNLPCEFPPVIGFEDMRLFSALGSLWTSSTVRQIHWDGNCEQVLAQLRSQMGNWYIGRDWTRMLPSKRETEKNWAPIGLRGGGYSGGSELLWMHRPGVTVNQRGEIVHNNPPDLTTDVISGGSQLVSWGDGDYYIALVHTAHQIPGSPCRYYYHRWAVYDQGFKLVKLSLPFVFEDKVIEFAAGLARHPTQPGTLVISYGFKDCEAKIATVSETEVMRLLL